MNVLSYLSVQLSVYDFGVWFVREECRLVESRVTSHPPACPVSSEAGGGVQLELLTVCRSDVELQQTLTSGHRVLCLTGCHTQHQHLLGVRGEERTDYLY